MGDVEDRLDRLETRLERQRNRIDDQRATIETQQNTIEGLRKHVAAGPDENRAASGFGPVSVSRRNALTAGGMLALLVGGLGTASADPQGQVGTVDRPLETLYTEALNGGLTGDVVVTSLTGPGIEIVDGELRVPASAPAPRDLAAVLGDMAGDGSSESPYQITDVRELQAMNAERAAHYELAGDIDATQTAAWNDGKGFDPIGSRSGPFTGTVDGNGYTISGLTIDRSEDDVGLFGLQEGSIQAVTLRDVSITGNDFVGTLVGANSEGVVRESLAEGSVTGTHRTGGLVGNNRGIIEHTAGSVTVSGGVAGGLVGVQHYGALRESYATGDVNGSGAAGGVAGDLAGSSTATEIIERTYATGLVTGRSDADVGGLIGYAGYGTVLDSYWDTNATDQGSAFGMALDNETVSGNDGLTTAEMRGGDADDNMGGLSFPGIWATVDAGNDGDVSSDGYPVLAALDRTAQLEVQ